MAGGLARAAATLVLEESRVKGHGAGMEPASGAVFEGDWWRSRPPLSPLADLTLARSAALPDWQLCVRADCRPLAEAFAEPIPFAPVRLFACARPSKSEGGQADEGRTSARRRAASLTASP